MLGEDGDIQFRNDGVVVADDAGIQLFTGLELGDEVVVNFLLNGFGTPAAGPQFGQRGGAGHRRSAHRDDLEFEYF